MSEEKLYVVKNDEGQYFDIDLPPWWDDKAGIAFKRIDLALGWAKKYGGHVVTLIEESEKVVLTKEQAEVVENAHEAIWPLTYITRLTFSSDDEELLMKAYVNGYTVEKEKKYNVKVPHTKTLIYYKVEDVDDLGVAQSDSEGTWVEFTAAEVEHYGLHYCEKDEVTDDEN